MGSLHVCDGAFHGAAKRGLEIVESTLPVHARHLDRIQIHSIELARQFPQSLVAALPDVGNDPGYAIPDPRVDRRRSVEQAAAIVGAQAGNGTVERELHACRRARRPLVTHARRLCRHRRILDLLMA
jgi:hypothetical protein